MTDVALNHEYYLYSFHLDVPQFVYKDKLTDGADKVKTHVTGTHLKDRLIILDFFTIHCNIIFFRCDFLYKLGR
jgi:hypothetical protein